MIASHAEASGLELLLQFAILAGVLYFVWLAASDGLVQLRNLFRPSSTSYIENKTLNLHVSDEEVHERSGYVAENVREKMERLGRGNS